MGIRDQVVRGTSVDKLQKDALAKEHTLEELIMRGQSYEHSRINSKAMAGKPVAMMEKREISANYRGGGLTERLGWRFRPWPA